LVKYFLKWFTFLLAQKKSNKRKQPAEIASGDLRGRARVLARLSYPDSIDNQKLLKLKI